MRTPRLAALLLAALLLGAGSAHAASSSSSSSTSAGPQGGPPPGPPPEAIAACKGKSEGTEVTFTGRNGESFTGTCQTVDGVLAAQPRGGRGRGPAGGQNPPPPPR